MSEMKTKNSRRREQWAWYLYDFGNYSFYFQILSNIKDKNILFYFLHFLYLPFIYYINIYLNNKLKFFINSKILKILNLFSKILKILDLYYLILAYILTFVFFLINFIKIQKNLCVLNSKKT